MHQRPDQMPCRGAREAESLGSSAAELPGGYQPGRADYPARLLTRRAFALRVESILKSRANAPRSWNPHRGR